MHRRVTTEWIKTPCSFVKKTWTWMRNLIWPPREYGEFLKDVVAILEMGAKGTYEKEQIEREAEKRKLEAVHLFGANGLFEESKGTGKYRLNNANGLPLMLNHLSIEETRRYSDRAFAVAIAAIIVAIVLAILR